MKKLNRKFYCLSCEHILSEQGFEFLEEQPIQGLPLNYHAEFCKNCGQKIEPKIEEIKNDYATTITALKNPKIKVVAFVAPSVRTGIGECFGLSGDMQQKIVTALKKLGAYEVFSMNFGADLTIHEESLEFQERMSSKQNLPMFTSCCPAWVNYVTQVYPQIKNNLSTCKSPQQMFGAAINNIYTKINNFKPTDIFILSVVPCLAKKVERLRPNINSGVGFDVDAAITTTELAELIKNNNIDFKALEDSPFDSLFKDYSGYGSMFGISGGVLLSVVNNTYPNAKITKKTTESIVEYKINNDGEIFYAAKVQGIISAKKVIEDVINKTSKYSLIEVMACAGGCVGGPGQPITKDINSRTEIIKNAQKNAKIVNSRDNLMVKKLYNEHISRDYAEILFHEKR